jgi:transposase
MFGIRGYKYVSTKYVDGGMEVRIMDECGEMTCPACGSKDVIRRGNVERSFRSLPVGMRPVWIVLDVQRIGCKTCGVVRQVPVNFADERKSYTKRFERFVILLSKLMPYNAVASILGIGWDMVKDIMKDSLGKRFKRPKLKRVRRIAIDEIHIGRGKYLSIVLDLDRGEVLFIGEGKDAASLKPFWRRLKAAHAQIFAVASDMSPAFINAVTWNLPGVPLIFDHFHIVKLFNEKLTEIRRRLFNEVKDHMHKQIIKGTRWLLLKNPENLDETRNERERLRDALEINKPLAVAYYLKEDLRQFWSQPCKATARRVITDWMLRAESSGNDILNKFAKLIGMYKEQILNYYDHRISTGPLEGLNSKIRAMQRQAYGFRDLEFLKLRIYAIHEAKFNFVG